MKNGKTIVKTAMNGWIVSLVVSAAVLTGCGGRKAGEMRHFMLPGGELMEMVWCPPGSFMMGSPQKEVGRGEDETRHKVTLTEGFWMAKYEVTQKQWDSVLHIPWKNDNPASHRGDDFPVENVSWTDSQRFCWKSGLQLPTEAQWEYACRAGSSGPYAGTGELDKMGWHDDNSVATTHAVGRKQPNAWGLYDMHGNVWEWCADWYGDYPKNSVTDPTGPAAGWFRVLRGGSFGNDPQHNRAASRLGSLPGTQTRAIGFRPVLPAKNEERLLKRARGK